MQLGLYCLLSKCCGSDLQVVNLSLWQCVQETDEGIIVCIEDYKTPRLQSMIPFDLLVVNEWVLKINFHPTHDVCTECRQHRTRADRPCNYTAQWELASRWRMLSISPLLMLANSSVAWHKNVSCPHYSFPYAVPNVWECKENVKNEQRAELPRVKLEYASNCRAPIWHRVEVGRAQLDRVKQARVKKDAPKWTDSVLPFLLPTHSVDCAVHLLLCHLRAIFVNSAPFLPFTAIIMPFFFSSSR